MKNNKRVFFLLEAICAVVALTLALIMFQENSGDDRYRVIVVLQNSDDNRWSALKYGLKMAAEDYGVELFVAGTGLILTAEEEYKLIEDELENGADAVIVQPVPGENTEDMLKKLEKKAPLILVGCMAAEGNQLPVVEPDNYAMGAALAEELLKDYSGNLEGKTIGIFSEALDSEASLNREKGFRDALVNTKAEICWSSFDDPSVQMEEFLETQPRVDCVVAFDDHSLTAAGKCAADNNLHGALVYGIGTSTEAVYYLDTGIVRCLVVPDEFNVGYQSLTEAVESLRHHFYKAESRIVTHTVMRKDELFSEENQEILFIMSQ